MDFSARRSIYGLGKDIPLSKEEVEDLIKHAILNSPSAFNSQTARVVLLWGKESDQLWDIVEQELRKVVPAENFSSTKDKLSAFRAGAGTILFFEESTTVRGLQEQFPLYADNFPVWALEGGGMVQFAVWTLLADKKIGASLQHYHPLISEAVARQWNIPQTWQLRAQMPFGSIKAPAAEKNVMPVSERFKIFA